MKNNNNKSGLKCLVPAWPEIEPRVRESVIALFLDYDGTLTPIVKHPPSAKLSQEGRSFLRGLARTRGIETAIVSGRSLSELKKLVRVDGLVYVGNHGLEVEGPSLCFIHPAAERRKKLIKKLRRQLQKAFQPFSDIFLENKAFALGIHYRGMTQRRAKQAKALLLTILRPYLKAGQFLLTEGKKVWEVCPSVRWNKGTTVLWLYGRMSARGPQEVFPIYVGDDRTDEDAFRIIKRKGLGIKVMEGKKEPTEALYYVRSPKEVFDFLKRLIEVKRKRF